jgi:glucose/arabinose dehydrogenase
MKKLLPLVLLCICSFYAKSQDIILVAYENGFDKPVDLKHAGDDRLFVVEQGGTIRIIDETGNTLATPFLDISGQVSGGSEQGLLSVAFHPDYATNGKFYVNYTKLNGDTRVSEFSVDAANPNLADPTSEVTIIEYSQPFSNHNGGCLQFGPDGYLYIASGDGGSGGDPGNRAQNTTLPLGKLLRIDVDNPVPGGTNYGIPPDNPFAGSTIEREEIWAFGLRNPWKFSFDSETNDLWIADVGQNAFEEINKVANTEAGVNYGWRCYEASAVFNDTGCPPPATLTFPIAEYSHAEGQSITGGYVYRGSLFPELEGYYFFADFISGLIGTVSPEGTFQDLGDFGGNWSTFGVDNTNELYVVGFDGVVSRVESPFTMGLDDETFNTFQMYPNPADDTVNLLTTNDVFSTVALLDMKGSKLISKEGLNVSQTQLEITNLPEGVYILKLTTKNNTSYIKKLVIE